MNNESKLIQTVSKHPFYIGLAAIFFLAAAFMVNFRTENIPIDISKWGQFGDYLGGVLNPIFGLMSVVIISVTLQLQIKSSKKQVFDNQFFSLLSLYDSVLQSIDRHSSRDGSVKKGRDCFYLFYRDIVRLSIEAKVPLNVAYSSFLETRGWEIEHYFRTIYHLFKHVKDGQASGLVAENEKKNITT